MATDGRKLTFTRASGQGKRALRGVRGTLSGLAQGSVRIRFDRAAYRRRLDFSRRRVAAHLRRVPECRRRLDFNQRRASRHPRRRYFSRHRVADIPAGVARHSPRVSGCPGRVKFGRRRVAGYPRREDFSRRGWSGHRRRWGCQHSRAPRVWADSADLKKRGQESGAGPIGSDWIFVIRRGLKARIAIARRLDRAATGNLGDVKPVGEGVSEKSAAAGAERLKGTRVRA